MTRHHDTRDTGRTRRFQHVGRGGWLSVTAIVNSEDGSSVGNDPTIVLTAASLPARPAGWLAGIRPAFLVIVARWDLSLLSFCRVTFDCVCVCVVFWRVR